MYSSSCNMLGLQFWVSPRIPRKKPPLPSTLSGGKRSFPGLPSEEMGSQLTLCSHCPLLSWLSESYLLSCGRPELKIRM